MKCVSNVVKRIVCFALAVAMVFAMGVSSVSAATKSSPLSEGEIIAVDNLRYKVTSVRAKKTVQFVGVDEAVSKVVIPAEIKIVNATYKVSSIGKNALRQDPELTELTIGRNVSIIRANAFRDCKSLKKIVVNTTKLKASMVGTNIVKNIAKNAKVYVPQSKYTSYKKIFRTGGSNYMYRF